MRQQPLHGAVGILGAVGLLAFALVGCRSGAFPFGSPSGYSSGSPSDLGPTSHEIERYIERLYAAFCFDPGEEASWEDLREMFAAGATFVSPPAPGEAPVGVDAEAFLLSFQQFIQSSPAGATGYHERVVRTRIDAVGQIAHAWVTFDGFIPGRAPDRRGVDSLQLVLEEGAWKLVSFTTQYEGSGVSLPPRFRPRD